MKATRLRSAWICRKAGCLFLATWLLGTIGPAPAATAVSGETILGFENAAGSPPRLVLHDPGNTSWMIQHSPNLVDWADSPPLRVMNGILRLPWQADGHQSSQYFRPVRLEALDPALSTVSLALQLSVPFPAYANPVLPASFLVPPISNQNNTPAGNAATDAGALLGRVLFYDRRLSLNQTLSCSSCHQQSHGFSDPARFSTGFAGGRTDRNSMGLTNAQWYLRRAFFRDERAATMEVQVLQPILNPVEMGMTLPELIRRLSAEPFYAELFTSAFGSAEVTSDRVARALAHFVRSIISTTTKFDAGVATNFANFTAAENLGRRIFNGQTGNATCTACHGTDNFVPGPNINNNGLENPYVDKGVGRVTGRNQDEGLFKVPSLRNIELTAPYMHDGRFQTLEEVVEFYNSGVVNHPNLSPPLRLPGGQPLRLNLRVAQKAALVAFLKTLTDPAIAADSRFSDPFFYGP